MAYFEFHPLIQQWFDGNFSGPTEPQTLGWPHIAADRHTLIAAPTGSGKTLAAFLVFIDRLFHQWLDNRLEDEIQIVYVSPLKALSNDIERNLRRPLTEINALAQQAGLGTLPLRVAVRTGDTPASQRQAMIRRPPHILVTTPESFYLLLTSDKGRDRLRTVKTVIVDEIHALARDKRGSHLSLSLERLSSLCPSPPVRIGLSATQKPMDQIAKFLVGCGERESNGKPAPDAHLATGEDTNNGESMDRCSLPCQIVDAGHVRTLDVALEVPPSELSAVCSLEQWGEVYGRLVELINDHRSTLIFVNTRRLAERVTHHLTEMLGQEAVASHHGSLSRQIRLSAEQRLKAGELKAIVATASLEMGIDIGYIDLVCQIGSPRSIATFLQRVGRSGHSVGATPQGRLFPLTRDELLESMSLVAAVRRGDLDRIEIPQQPLDILAQQIIAEVACREWDEEPLFELCRRAWPFRSLTRSQFESVVQMTSEGVVPTMRRGVYVHRDRINGRLKARRGARLAALTSGGAIPETAEYRVVTETDKTFVGTLDEDFAIESQSGDIFLLGNTSWRIRYVRGGEVVVNDAAGAPPTIPFWFGEAPGRTVELSREVSHLRQAIADQCEPVVRGEPEPRVRQSKTIREPVLRDPSRHHHLHEWLGETSGAGEWAAEQAIRYVAAQKAAVGLVPTHQNILFERFFDESGGMQLVIHSPLGARINRAWGLALRKRFCRRFDFELQAAADDNGIVLSIGPQHSFPIDDLFTMLRTDNARYLLEQALLAVPMFQVRWRWNVTRALAVLRREGGKKVPPHLQRFRSDDLLAATFPETVGCLENHHGDIEIPDHPLVQQTVHDCLHEAMDVDRWLQLLANVEAGEVRLIARDTREPSPFSQELLNANPYAFLDDAPLEERRTRAVATRRSLSLEAFNDLTQLDAGAIAHVRRQAWPLVRDADELHEALMSLILVSEAEGSEWTTWYHELVVDGRATTVQWGKESTRYWTAAERWPLIQSVYNDAVADPPPKLPDELAQPVNRSDGWTELVRGRMQHDGPVDVEPLAGQLRLERSQVESALEALEGQGVVLRGHFTDAGMSLQGNEAVSSAHPASANQQWCDRRLLARIHRLTLDGLRQQIQPVEPADYLRFLIQHQHLESEVRWGGPAGVREVIEQLQGFQLSAGAWEARVLAARVSDYDPNWLDQLFLCGEVMWGRLCPPQRTNRQKGNAALTRRVPISMFLREELAWLVPNSESNKNREVPGEQWNLRSNARVVAEALHSRGALFFQELVRCSDILPTQLEESLRELAAQGLVTSDTFAAVRAMVVGHRRQNRPRRRRKQTAAATSNGRWSSFPGLIEPATREHHLENWCKQLLRRYGVVFRELLIRESAAPSWFELVSTFRRLELRGEIRGGRFVRGVAGEQFATETAVTQLRKVRDSHPSGNWIVISAADPVNLAGIVDATPRIPATHRNTLIVQDGQVIAAKQADQILFFQSVNTIHEADMRRALALGRKTPRNEDVGQEMPIVQR